MAVGAAHAGESVVKLGPPSVTVAPPLPAVVPAREASRAELEEQAYDLLAEEHPTPRAARRRAVSAALDWLVTFPGDGWQQRWHASGADSAGPAWRPAGSTRDSRQRVATGVMTLVCLDAVRPGYPWLSGTRVIKLPALFRRVIAQAEFELLRTHAIALGSSVDALRDALNVVTRVAIVTGKAPLQISPEDMVGYVQAMRRADCIARRVELVWTLLRGVGALPGAGLTMRQHRQGGPRSPAELVDRYRINCRPLRGLLVRYVEERSPALDYSSLRALAYRLAVLFWGDLERHHPGIDSLRLTPAVARDWKHRLSAKANGEPRAQYLDILLSVRSLYLDLAQWALTDPASWAKWAAPCPVTEADLAAYPKYTRRRTARMQQRTRTLTPVLPTLLEAATRRLASAEALLSAATAAAPGAEFTVGGIRYRRLVPHRGHEGRPIRVAILEAQATPNDDHPTGRITPAREEDEAFWTWALVEVLRQTGVRLEEALELTHLSVRRYTQPSGEVIPLLQISPSKTDSERVLPASPELVAVLARLIRRVKAEGKVIPLAARYDPYEQTHSAPLPYLFQRPLGHRPTVISQGQVRSFLDRLAIYAGLRDVDGSPLRFVPHDFRRIFATETVNAGLPIHIAAKLLGHLDLNTTQGYVAIYPEQVIRHYRDFIDRRRSSRPDEEYRVPTAAEWTEFEAHFGQRKVALGTCARPYGTPCIHEHACVRCPMLRIDPAQLPRLHAIEQNTLERLAEARQRTWLGEVAGLEESLRHIGHKKEQVVRLQSIQPTDTEALA